METHVRLRLLLKKNRAAFNHPEVYHQSHYIGNKIFESCGLD